MSLFNAQNLVPSSMSEFTIDKEGSTISQVWYSPVGKVGEVGKFNKMEVGLKLGKEIEGQIEDFINK